MSLLHMGPQYSFGSEDYKRLVPTSCRHLFWSQDEERLVLLAVRTRSGDLRCHEGGTPQCYPHPLTPRRSKNDKWLVRIDCHHSYGTEDDKRLPGAQGCGHLFWS